MKFLVKSKRMKHVSIVITVLSLNFKHFIEPLLIRNNNWFLGFILKCTLILLLGDYSWFLYLFFDDTIYFKDSSLSLDSIFLYSKLKLIDKTIIRVISEWVCICWIFEGNLRLYWNSGGGSFPFETPLQTLQDLFGETGNLYKHHFEKIDCHYDAYQNKKSPADFLSEASVSHEVSEQDH